MTRRQAPVGAVVTGVDGEVIGIVKSRMRRLVFAAGGRDVAAYRPLLSADMTEVGVWVNAQSGWTSIAVVGDVMRDRAREILAAFAWSEPG